MNFDDPEQVSLAGRLILADPSLREPTFHRSVLLLTNHSAEEGAHGYILNRPLGKSVGELLPEEEFSSLSKVPVFIGGPVNAEQLTFSSIHWNTTESTLDFVPPGIRTLADVTISFFTTDLSTGAVQYGGGDADLAPTLPSAALHDGLRHNVDDRGSQVIHAQVLTDDAQRISTRQSVSSANHTVYIQVHGWVDTRGRDS